MAAKSKAKASQAAAVRTLKGKGGRRAGARVKGGRDIPIMPIATLVLLVALAIGMIVYVIINTRPTPLPATVDGIPCDSLEHTQTHYHAALQIMYQGNVYNLPSGIGISGGEANPTCFYWLHVHAAYPNVIHIESPANDVFTLGQFFAVWNAWSTAQGDRPQKLDATHVSTFTLTKDETLVVYVDLGDGKGATLFTGDPSTIILRAHETITLEISPPTVAPPPSFTFTSGL